MHHPNMEAIRKKCLRQTESHALKIYYFKITEASELHVVTCDKGKMRILDMTTEGN